MHLIVSTAMLKISHTCKEGGAHFCLVFIDKLKKQLFITLKTTINFEKMKNIAGDIIILH